MGSRAALRAIAALAGRDPETARLCFDFLAFKIPEVLARAMEEMMPPEQDYLSDWFRDAHAKGRAEGRAEGQLAGQRRALRTILSARGLELDGDMEARLDTCQELHTLELWTRRAANAANAAEVFDAP